MRQSPKSALHRAVSILESSGVRETEGLNQSVIVPVDPFWKMEVRASDRILLPRR
ncbi:hypothetical protein ACK8P5_06805 [Paenibacillus sp. EC2-1]|uniref:hypothetical protein n=1 Tax=Paenibacillus sp. EC2-1 TaxID=3388665 RepID=UPI003BEF0839